MDGDRAPRVAVFVWAGILAVAPPQATTANSAAPRCAAADAVSTLHAAPPFNGEDFALFLNRVPGAMLFLGVANPAEGIDVCRHMPDFAADERAIGVGVRAMASLLASRLMNIAPQH